MARPNVNTTPVADSYADKRRERIIEFGTAGRDECGGLIRISNNDDGTTSVHLYRLDAKVRVFTDGEA